MSMPELQGGNQLLNEYFDDLLQEPDLKVVSGQVENAADETAPPDTIAESVESRQADETPPTELVGDEMEHAVEVVAADDDTKPQPKRPTRPQVSLDLPPALEHWRENDRHDCLLLTLAGITLAMPLCCVDLPKPWPESVQPLEETLFQGHYLQDERQRVVVHLAEIVMPGKGVPQREGIVVPMLELPWSLRVDDLQGTRSFAGTDINWNRTGSKRPWLAGMVKGQPVAMVDPLELARMLAGHWQTELA